MTMTAQQAATMDEVRRLREAALEHTRTAQRLALQRRDLMQSLIDQGLSQADLGRELGVTRQAVQKMLAL